MVHEYFNICQANNFFAITITGEDKGAILDKKLAEFKHSKNCRILITTLQKTSEGFNFDFATHIIILEFWWNPQKILQAMGRTDRKSQNNDIYTYLLCYHQNNNIIKEENIVFKTMQKKIEDRLSKNS